jgi:prepilin-type N-terminal cleavage/methylation domain-containing protein
MTIYQVGDREEECESGFGLIEILVSMLLLALIAVAVLPTIVTGLRAAASNATLAAATGLVNQQMEDARSQSTCGSLAAPDFTVPDSRGGALTVSRIVGPCSAPYPRPVQVTVKVVRDGSGASVSSASTLVFIDGP